MSIDEMILRIANNGLNNDDQLNALKYSKESLREEVERSKAMINAYLINNKSTYILYKENVVETSTTKVATKKSFYGFINESEIEQNDNYIYPNIIV